MSKENLINTITKKIYDKFNDKYGEQFQQTKLGLEQINIIVTTKLNNTPKISRETIPNIINELKTIIDTKILKYTTNINNSENVIKKTNKTLQEQLYELEQKQKNNDNNNSNSNGNDENNKIQNLNQIVTDNNSLNNDFRDNIFQISEQNNNRNNNNIISENYQQNKQYYNLVINKNNNNIKYNNDYDYVLDKPDFFVNKMITKIKLKQCILKENNIINKQPYLIINIKEINSNFKTSLSNTIFCYLDLFKTQNNYLYYDTKDKELIFKTPINLNTLSINIKDSNNSNILKEAENNEKEAENNKKDAENNEENNEEENNSHLIIEIEYYSRI